MKNRLYCLMSTLLLAVVAGCATVDYQPYEGNNNLYHGDGGTKLTVNGVDFWANGAPPRKYTVVGIVTSEIGSGVGDESMIRSAVASKIKEQGGNAAIELSSSEKLAGVLKLSPSLYSAANTKRMRFAVVRYVE
ncbi:hypothetical protein WL29_22130 [Burkholderia ubonensis]|uniref:Lipoprotein n=1 Tax=Burkholderia ubonensis TaxID=101571 RepID=A0A106QD88_9BURK|nr:hypothetical protein [Burkholderia ubonensis]KWA84067.1 hypothetical protein WL29_22130 [Burkholderia ubonensis]